MYTLYIKPAAERELKRLPSIDRDKVAESIAALSIMPRPPGCRKIRGGTAAFRIRVGVYRVLYEVDDRQRMVEVFRVGPRRSVYRKRS